ncbi:M20/M25/M40 family metallo-hydrolase [Nonomuraea diastatica]|uniref:M20/M25/M40 family metallo-hydrolase n=1 Tax=Nonomuraea diastatica TaxID=1848329 RepID=A0A4V2YDB0_9ACTN|nr:M20/M25/M40 family metallo-hydrolase [Nonomuraea diastatica]TDD14596.1 M20/M25/M40 family metallo-hydrolase [Nonomuraea diastatica]
MIAKLFDTPRRLSAGLAALLVVAAVIMVTAMADSTMQPLPATAPDDQFSAERALVHLKAFATEPRPIGSAASHRARDYLTRHLRAAGLEVETQRSVGARSAAGLATFGQVDNIVGRLRGTHSTGTVLIAAHYDSAAMGPGASDDGASVAAMLETVRALRGSPGPRNDIVLLMSDGEEDGVLGAEAFVREHPLGKAGGVLLNWEARGVSGPSLMFETSANNARLVETLADAVPAPRGHSAMVELYRLLPNNTDFTPLTKAGFTGMNFAYIQRSSLYHTAGDSIANLNRGSLQHHGSNMLALARALGDADLRTLVSDHDVTYFRALGTMITYTGQLVWPLAVLAVVAVAGLALVARVRRLLSLPRLAVATVSVVVPLVASVALAQGLWELLVAWRPAYDLMGGLLHSPRPYQAAIAVLCALAVLGWYVLLRRRVGPAALTVGALAWLAGLGLLCARFAPGASFLFALPALLGALGWLAAVQFRMPAWARTAVAMPGPVTAAMVLPSLAGNVFDGMGLALGGVSALVLALFGLIAVPSVELFLPDLATRPKRATVLAVPLTALFLAAGLVAAGLVVDDFDADQPQRTHLAYVMDAVTRTAHWVSADAEPAQWTRRYVSGHDTSALPPGYARGTLWTGPAPAIAAESPRADVLAHSRDTLKLRVTVGKGTRSVTLRLDQPIIHATASAGRFGSARVPVTGTRAGTWPSEIRFRGIPAQGVQITIRIPDKDRIRLTVIAETDGFAAVPGFVPRPPGLVAATREDGDLTAVTRSYSLTRDS